MQLITHVSVDEPRTGLDGKVRRLPIRRVEDEFDPEIAIEQTKQVFLLGAHEGPMTVFVYVNTSKQVGDPDHLKVFANADAAEAWFEQNDPEGVAFEYEVLG